MGKERPIIENIVLDRTLVIEGFQNSVLRPIIKMQHSFLTLYFKNYLIGKKIKLKEATKLKQKERIDTILSKDNNLKKLIIGAIIGHFSDEELNYYLGDSNELNRRIIQIVNQRLKDSIQEIL